MEPTEKARSAGFGVLRRAKVAWGGVEGGSRRQKIQLAGSKDGAWVYTQPPEESKKEILASMSSYVTGTTLVVDGGFLAV